LVAPRKASGVGGAAGGASGDPCCTGSRSGPPQRGSTAPREGP